MSLPPSSVVPRVERFPMMQQPTCVWCRCFPCICRREEACVCGGAVIARDGEILLAVREHQRSQAHAAWRAERGL